MVVEKILRVEARDRPLRSCRRESASQTWFGHPRQGVTAPSPGDDDSAHIVPSAPPPAIGACRARRYFLCVVMYWIRRLRSLSSRSSSGISMPNSSSSSSPADDVEGIRARSSIKRCRDGDLVHIRVPAAPHRSREHVFLPAFHSLPFPLMWPSEYALFVHPAVDANHLPLDVGRRVGAGKAASSATSRGSANRPSGSAPGSLLHRFGKRRRHRCLV